MNDWGSGSYTSGWNANYILLAQAAQNEYDSYEKAEEILMLADIYKDDDEKLESIYRKALKTEKLNFDAWLGLVNLYEKDDQKTEEEYYAAFEKYSNATIVNFSYGASDAGKAEVVTNNELEPRQGNIAEDVNVLEIVQETASEFAVKKMETSYF